jgi:hypothetical protein
LKDGSAASATSPFGKHGRGRASAAGQESGAIVEARSYEDTQGRKRLSLATRSDLDIEAQITASGATWLDRQSLARDAVLANGGFGSEVRDAMDRRVDHLAAEGLVRRQGARVIFARDLLNLLRQRELDMAIARLSAETGLVHDHSSEGERIVGVYRRRLTLASGRFAMINDGHGYQLVPWRPALEQHLRSAGIRRRSERGRGDLELWKEDRSRNVITQLLSLGSAKRGSAFVRQSIRTLYGCD